MPEYIVNKNAQPNGDHEVHVTPRSKCSSPAYPDLGNQLRLGNFADCAGAVRAAKRHYPTADGCYYCSNDCHKS